MNKQPLSAEQYINSRARTLKIDRCLGNADWETSKIAHVIVIRRHTNGNFTYSGYLVDLLCPGVKDTYYGFNQIYDTVDLSGIIKLKIRNTTFTAEDLVKEDFKNRFYAEIKQRPWTNKYYAFARGNDFFA